MTSLAGNTIARYGNPYHSFTLAGATIIFYQHSIKDVSSSRTLWDWKATEQSAVSTTEFGRAQVADDGSYELDLKGYKGGPLLIALLVEKFAYAPETDKTAYGLLGLAKPDKRDQEGFYLNVDIPRPSYCGILAALDLWLVSGRVSDCKTKQNSLIGATVKAYDRDITQDDYLGESTTDATGSFAIFFSSSTFKGIPVLPPPWDVIPPHELFGGPDVFFHVSSGATDHLIEPPSMGRTAGRENVPNCSYHELCVQTPVWTPPTVTLWSKIGNYRVPDGGSLQDFDADGLTTSGKLAFTGNIDFNGQVSPTFLGNAVSFRFVYAEWSDMTTTPTYPADYTPLLASNINLNAAYGSIFTSTGPNPWDYTLTPVKPVPDTDGWIAVDQSPNFVRTSGDPMVQVITSSLVPSLGSISQMEGTTDAGVAVPAGPFQDRQRKFSFVLEIKTISVTAYQTVPVPIHINNTPVYLRYDLTELQTGACNTITPSGGSVTVNPIYTVAHPYLQYYRINVRRQGGTNLVVKDENFATNGVLWTNSTGEFGTQTAVYTDIGKCSYRSSIVADRRLTSGYGGVIHQNVLRTFCVD